MRLLPEARWPEVVVGRPRFALPAGPMLVAAVLGVMVAVGISVAVGQGIALVVWGGAVGIVSLAVLGARVVPLFLNVLAIVLAGYAFLGRGLAHVGVPPLYLGEFALGLGIVATVAVLPRIRPSPVHYVLTAFLVWGVLRTIPFLGTYGIDALRDAVTWGYGLFAIAVAAALAPGDFPRLLTFYRGLVPLFVVWVPIAAFIGRVVDLPAGPGSDVSIVSFKGGDMGVQLAGVGAFLLVGLYGGSERIRRAVDRAPRIAEAALWVAWIVAAGIVAVFNRGGMAAMTSVGATVFFIRSVRRWLLLTFVGVSIVAVGIAVDPTVDLPGARSVSFGQIAENVSSIFGDESDAGLAGTKEFRIRWWSTIIGYTFNGDYFWTGKGFGVNLADVDGFQVTADGSLRAPHNGHFEILARMGVPGLALWLALQVVFAGYLVTGARRARQLGQTTWVAVLGWIFVFWAAALIDASFDPYLQGPQGGIWYWTLVGLGIAAVEAIRSGVDPFGDQERAVHPNASEPGTLRHVVGNEAT